MDRRYLIFLVVATTFIAASAEANNVGYKLLKKVHYQCETTPDPTKCTKTQLLRILIRAVQTPHIKLTDGITMELDSSARSLDDFTIPEEQLQNLDNQQVDSLIVDTTARLFQTHRVKLDVPQLVEEGRGKMKKMMGMLMSTMAVTGTLMMMTMKGIGMMAGTGMMAGKLSLILSLIMLFKKLMSGSGKEKSHTVEIIKIPQKGWSSSGGGTDSYAAAAPGGGGGSWRSFESGQDMAYNAHV